MMLLAAREDTLMRTSANTELELRDLIWKFALPGPQTIFLQEEETAAICKISCDQDPTTLFGVNRESRELALKVYKQMRPGVPIFTNLLVNTLHFKNTISYCSFMLELLHSDQHQNLAKGVSFDIISRELRHAAFEDSVPYQILDIIPFYLPNLKKVSFNSDLNSEIVGSLTKPKQVMVEWARQYLEIEWKKDGRTTKVPEVDFV